MDATRGKRNILIPQRSEKGKKKSTQKPQNKKTEGRRRSFGPHVRNPIRVGYPSGVFGPHFLPCARINSLGKNKKEFQPGNTFDLEPHAPYLLLLGDTGTIDARGREDYERFLGKIACKFVRVFIVLGEHFLPTQPAPLTKNNQPKNKKATTSITDWHARKRRC